MSDVTVKQGDTLPPVQGTCQLPDGTSADLTDADAITFRMTPESAGLADDIAGAASAVGDPTAGVVEYPWQAGDTAIPGLYRAEFHVHYLDGSSETFPSEGYISVEVQRAAVAA